MKNKVIEIISDLMDENQIEYSIASIEEGTTLSGDLGLDSFNLAQLTVQIEEEFGVDIFENGVITTVGDIINQVK